jgi:hypothetical protein
MSLNFYFNNPCPRCGKLTTHVVIDRHPTNRDLAVKKFRCGLCGPIKTEILSLKPPRRPDVAMSTPIKTAERNGLSVPR